MRDPTKTFSTDLKEVIKQLKFLSPEELETKGIISKARTSGYICNVCRDGSGRDGTGISTKLLSNGQSYYCGKCGKAYDNLDLFAAHFGKDIKRDFTEIVSLAAELYDINHYTNFNPQKPLEKNYPIVPDKYKNFITNANARLKSFVDNQGGAWRGLFFDTLNCYLCGWANCYGMSGEPALPHLIIPTSYNQYLARLIGNPDDYPAAEGIKINPKPHHGSKELFGLKLALNDDPFIFLVEGEIDAMSIRQASGFNVISICGSALIDKMRDQLKNVATKNFIVLLDNDETGKEKSKLVVNALAFINHNAKSFNLSDNYKDANDFLQADPEGLAARLKAIYSDAQKYFRSSAQDTDNPNRYEKLFEGFKPINISAGAILNVADADTKATLETLFVEKNFIAFASKVSNDQTISNDDDPALIYKTPFGDYNISTEQVKTALTWLINKTYPYFNSNQKATKKFLTQTLKAAKAEGAIKILQDDTFFLEAIKTAPKYYFNFDEKFKRELINFAKHSNEIFQSLLRFDYQRTERFLENDFTDLVCAELLVDVQKDFLRYDIEQDTWYVWNKNHWQAISVKSKARIYDLWTPLARKARIFAEYERLKKYCELDDLTISNPDNEKDNDVIKEKCKRLKESAKSAHKKFLETKALENSRAIDNFLEQASGLPEIQIRTIDLNKNKYLFNCSNCTINLESMEKYPARQEDLITLATSTEYNQNAQSKDWDNFLLSAIPDKELCDWLQRFFGYCLSGDVSEHIFLFIHGIGGSGKTTFLNAIIGAMGDYAKVFSVNMITENKKQKDGNEPEPALADLKSCRFACSSETKKNRRLDEAFIKLLSGGNILKARELHKPPFEFMPNFKIAIDGNFLLRISDINDEGLRRRIRIAPFNHPPARNQVDTKLTQKLSTPESKSAILNWLIDGWKKYQEHRLKDTPAAMTNALDDFYNSNDSISDFLETHGYITGDKNNKHFRIPVMNIWKTYNEWQRKTPGTTFFSRADFVASILQSLKDDGVELKSFDNKQYFVGFSIDEKEIVPPSEYQ